MQSDWKIRLNLQYQWIKIGLSWRSRSGTEFWKVTAPYLYRKGLFEGLCSTVYYLMGCLAVIAVGLNTHCSDLHVTCYPCIIDLNKNTMREHMTRYLAFVWTAVLERIVLTLQFWPLWCAGCRRQGSYRVESSNEKWSVPKCEYVNTVW